ncbi:MAG: hypothetical protein AB7O04_00585 [Hyphomonadaceae bacterium]
MRAPIAALMFACAAFPAEAQTQTAASIAGHWTFQTEAATDRRCVIRGAAVIAPAAGRGAFSLQMSTHETCRDGHEWRSEQRCTATQSGQSVRIDCDIISATPANYAPDDFALQMRGPDAMHGTLLSSWNARAHWRRAAPALVS